MIKRLTINPFTSIVLPFSPFNSSSSLRALKTNFFIQWFDYRTSSIDGETAKEFNCDHWKFILFSNGLESISIWKHRILWFGWYCSRVGWRWFKGGFWSFILALVASIDVCFIGVRKFPRKLRMFINFEPPPGVSPDVFPIQQKKNMKPLLHNQFPLTNIISR